MAELIRGKIARILDEYTVYINRGLEHGVKEGMTFIIYDEGSSIKDPDTGNVLGNIEIVKARVVVREVQEKMSRATTPSYSTFPILTSMANIRDRLIVSEEEKKEEEEKSSVRIGDKVRQVAE